MGQQKRVAAVGVAALSLASAGECSPCDRSVCAVTNTPQGAGVDLGTVAAVADSSRVARPHNLLHGCTASSCTRPPAPVVKFQAFALRCLAHRRPAV